MSETASISSGIAARYATAVFDLALEEDAVPALEADVDALDAALADSPDLAAMIRSPIYTRAQQGAAITALAKSMDLGTLMSNTLALMAEKRRLFVLPQLIAALRDRIAAHKGEVVAEVTSARSLTPAESDRLADVLRARVGQDVVIKPAVDEALIGGLVVKVGSTMIDTSIRSKLDALQNSMKEVG